MQVWANNSKSPEIISIKICSVLNQLRFTKWLYPIFNLKILARHLYLQQLWKLKQKDHKFKASNLERL